METIIDQEPIGVCSCGISIYDTAQFNAHEDAGHVVDLYEDEDEE